MMTDESEKGLKDARSNQQQPNNATHLTGNFFKRFLHRLKHGSQRKVQKKSLIRERDEVKMNCLQHSKVVLRKRGEEV